MQPFIFDYNIEKFSIEFVTIKFTLLGRQFSVFTQTLKQS